jgi:predicted O-linked N-acetylglucosamine transferase (SPINDLY family)
VSGDLDHDHPVGRFTDAILRNVDHKSFRLLAYSTLSRDARLDVFDAWHDVEHEHLQPLVDRIQNDEVDILVDLAGYTAGNRLPLFAIRCAPVQATWLGYSGTTGLREMDYLIGDRWIIPPEEERLYSEAIWRLPDSYLCWTPPADPIEIGPLPAGQNGHVTFGCFNNVRKISAPTVATWMRILEAVPHSRLLLKSAGSDPVAYERVTGMFDAAGLDRERWEIIEIVPDKTEHFRHYNRVDIALDPFPYQGTTTTVEALWMGVPVLSLVGDRFIARVGESILQTVGLSEWIGSDRDDYVRKAVDYAADLPRLAALRASLRTQLLASPLCDAPRFARNLEAALRGMWQEWCNTQVQG